MRTQDTTPPTLTLEDIPTPGLTNFSLVVSLSEPGTIYGAVMFTNKADTVTAAPACPPSWQVRRAGQKQCVSNPPQVCIHAKKCMECDSHTWQHSTACSRWSIAPDTMCCSLPPSLPSLSAFHIPPLPPLQGPTLMIFRQNVTQGGVNVTLGPFVVPQENTNYTVRLIAEDVYTNCQEGFSRVTVATADRNPPVFLALGATNVTGNASVLVFGLNKRGSISYQVAATDATPCPTAAQVGMSCSQPCTFLWQPTYCHMCGCV